MKKITILSVTDNQETFQLFVFVVFIPFTSFTDKIRGVVGLFDNINILDYTYRNINRHVLIRHLVKCRENRRDNTETLAILSSSQRPKTNKIKKHSTQKVLHMSNKESQLKQMG